MTLFLINRWRSILRRSLSLYRPVNSMSEVSTLKSPDALTVTIKAAPDVSNLLVSVERNVAFMNHKHMMQTLRRIFDLYKAGEPERKTDNLVQNASFSVFCQHFKKHARALDINEAIEATKVLCYLQIPAEALIVQTVLQMIRSQINMINIKQIVFLDFILNKFNRKNHLVDALKHALPLAFQIHLPVELDNENLPLLKDMFIYSCTHDVPDRYTNNIVTALLLHDQAIDAKSAKTIVWCLCSVNCTEERFPTRVQLLHKCYDILVESIHELSRDDVIQTVARIKHRVLHKYPEYYHEQLMDAIGNYVVTENLDFEEGLIVAKAFSRMAHTHLDLTEKLCQQVLVEPEVLANARIHDLFSFINCLSNSDFIPNPEEWDEIKKQITLNPVFEVDNLNLPWAKVCLELASLGCYDEKIIKKVFSKDFLDELLDKEDNVLNYLQLLTLSEAVKTFYSDDYKLPAEILEKAKSFYPFHSNTALLVDSLAQGLGGDEYVVKNVVLPSGIVADALICLQGGRPMKLLAGDKADKMPLEALNIPLDAAPVCLMNFSQGCFSVNSNRLRGTFRLILNILEKKGYAAVAVNYNNWLHTPEHERTPYLMREIMYKCGEIGMKLRVT